MGSCFTKCWAVQPTYTRLGRLLVRYRVHSRAPNEDERLTMTTFVAAGEVIALADLGAVVPEPLSVHDHSANMLLHDAVIQSHLMV